MAREGGREARDGGNYGGMREEGVEVEGREGRRRKSEVCNGGTEARGKRQKGGMEERNWEVGKGEGGT